MTKKNKKTKLIQHVNIAIDLNAIIQKTINNTTSLVSYQPKKGALGVITILNEIYDLYLLIPETKLSDDEIMRWLKAAQIDTCFRKFIPINQSLENLLLQNSIGVTITSDLTILRNAEKVSTAYFVKRRKADNISQQIQSVNSWKEIIRHVTTLTF